MHQESPPKFVLSPEFLEANGFSPTFPERFWKKVDKENGPIPDQVKYPGLDRCWVWTGALCSGGYGSMMAKYVKGGPRIISSHRASWILHYGVNPSLGVLHACDVRKCCRISHLFLGTTKDNALDASKKGRFGDRNGERNSHHKLTNADVLKIREMYSTENYTLLDLSKEFGVTQTSIWEIATRKQWTHI